MARRKPAEHHEEHADETWLIPYSDLLTLLLALFIVLFATASVDAQKLEQMAQSFNAAFNGSPSILDKQASITEMQSGVPSQSGPSASDANKEQAMESVQLNEVKKKLDNYIQNNNLTGDLQTSLTVDGLVIRIQDTALFTSGRADMRPESRRWAHVIAAMLGTLSQSVVVSGHTDNVPINTAEFPSNWDLSSKRALNFMKFLLAEDLQLQPERFSAIGFGEYRPVAVNTDTDGRAKNRRVEVLILKQYR
jgi:chemotaxis protein MotB